MPDIKYAIPLNYSFGSLISWYLNNVLSLTIWHVYIAVTSAEISVWPRIH